MQHRVFTLLTLSLALCLSPFTVGVAEESGDTVTKVRDLEALSEQASEHKLPILIMFSQDQCPYCTIMEENYLRPMLRSGQYKDKIIIRKVKIDDYKTLTDFNGKRIDAEELTSRYGSWVTPTLVFLNSEGKEIAPKLVGIGTEGFFAGDIDNAIEVALTHLRSVALK